MINDAWLMMNKCVVDLPGLFKFLLFLLANHAGFQANQCTKLIGLQV